MEKFYLDLATILQNFRQNGELYADLPAKKLGNKVPWKAQIRVDEGIITSCQILDKRGTVVNSGDPALEALYKVGSLSWEVVPDLLDGSGTGKLPAFTPQKKSGPLPVSTTGISAAPVPDPVPGNLPVPSRLITITLKQMNQTQWPRDYRLVYILIDGLRTAEKIASMLAMPLADVEQILHELQVMRIIDLNP